MSDKKSKSIRRMYPLTLTVAGSDSGGGAGIEADLRTFNAFGVFGCCVISAVTAQNPRHVTRIEAMSPEMVKAQIDAIVSCFAPAFMKTGMLADPEIVETVAAAAEKYRIKMICDPVLYATCGSSLGGGELLEVFRSRLLPAAAWITPNVPEAELILGDERKIASEKELFDAALALHERFGVSVVLKGGHLDLNVAVDAVCRDGKLYRLTSPLAEAGRYAAHGTGCTFSAALTAGLTLDYPWKQALCEAKSFVLGSLSQSVELAPGINAMYPPTEDCYELVKLEPYKD